MKANHCSPRIQVGVEFAEVDWMKEEAKRREEEVDRHKAVLEGSKFDHVYAYCFAEAGIGTFSAIPIRKLVVAVGPQILDRMDLTSGKAFTRDDRMKKIWIEGLNLGEDEDGCEMQQKEYYLFAKAERGT